MNLHEVSRLVCDAILAIRGAHPSIEFSSHRLMIEGTHLRDVDLNEDLNVIGIAARLKGHPHLTQACFVRLTAYEYPPSAFEFTEPSVEGFMRHLNGLAGAVKLGRMYTHGAIVDGISRTVRGNIIEAEAPTEETLRTPDLDIEDLLADLSCRIGFLTTDDAKAELNALRNKIEVRVLTRMRDELISSKFADLNIGDRAQLMEGLATGVLEPLSRTKVVSDLSIGQAVMDAIISNEMVTVDDEAAKQHLKGKADGYLFVWKPYAAKSIGTCVKKALQL